MRSITPRTLLAVGAASAVVAITCACQPTPPVVGDTDPFHSGFPIAGAHGRLDCAECHIDGAREQGVTPERDNGWANALLTDCLSCHRDTTAQIFPGGHKDGLTCSSAGCHSGSDFCWGQVWRACGDPGDTDPPPPSNHEGQTALNFPLEGVHAGECASCHPDGTFDGQLGGGDRCTDCHLRVGDTANIDALHYPPPRDGAEEKERDCKACHARNQADSKLLVPPTWLDSSYDHKAVTPHAVVEDWDQTPEVLRAEADWVECSSCHLTPGNYTAWSCDSAGCHTPDTLSFSHPTYLQNDTCAGCHPEGTE